MVTQVFLLALLVTFIIQAILVAWYVFALTSHRKQVASDEDCPQVTVLLCVRGTDPTLETCLRALLALDYPREKFRLRVMIDHASDSGGQFVRRLLADVTSIDAQVVVFDQPKQTCSLKCSALIAGVQLTDETDELIVLVDADTNVYASWLREIAAGFQSEKVGAVTGLRWYVPTSLQLGTMMRFLWNTAAIVQMFCYRIAWGGTLAIRRRVIMQSGLLDRWQRALCEDTMIAGALSEHGFVLRIVPSLVMISREDTSITGFVGWLKRQLLTLRLHNRAWGLVLAHAISISSVFFGSLIFVVGLAMTGHLYEASVLGLGVLAYQLANLVMLASIEWGTRIAAAERNVQMQWVSLSRLWVFLQALFGTQLFYLYAAIAAHFARRISWRGIEYEIAAGKVRMIEYRPFVDASNGSNTKHSL
jgi:cellulose synthase/poly-beta-1,6-N-acetylglucosamine synthase-like glycosyltransferase